MILCGAAGLGKTEFACALIHKVSFAGAYHFINKQDRLRDVVFCPGEGLMVDEACMAGNSIDDVKSILDLAKGRDVECRNRDGFIPKHTPRIFLPIGLGIFSGRGQPGTWLMPQPLLAASCGST